MAKQRQPVMRWARPDERVGKLHDWKPKPGNKTFIVNRGIVRFDIPEEWTMTFGDDSFRMNDKEPPDDNCLLQVSVHYLPPGIDWTGLPLKNLIEGLPDDDTDERRTLSRGETVEIKRGNLEIAWQEQRVLDVKENRECISRIALARANDIQPLITFDLWPEDAKRFDPVWHEVLRSLHVGQQAPVKEVPVSPLVNENSLLTPYSTTTSILNADAKRKAASVPAKPQSTLPKLDGKRPTRTSDWERQGTSIPLPENHGWKSEPGCKIFVANRGEVRFDYPADWIIGPREPITFWDREPPADTCRLRLNIYHPTKHQKKVPPIGEALMDLIDIFRYENNEDTGYSMGRGEITVVPREDLELAWRQFRYFNPNLGREVTTRAAVARSGNSIALLLFDYPTADKSTHEPIWDTLLRSLQMGLYIEDPRRYFLH
ncbi:MAG TPA: hypothetical protein VH482_06040 [Thermomicrobiales bacterium]|jgi:hypothetical protein